MHSDLPHFHMHVWGTSFIGHGGLWAQAALFVWLPTLLLLSTRFHSQYARVSLHKLKFYTPLFKKVFIFILMSVEENTLQK